MTPRPTLNTTLLLLIALGAVSAPRYVDAQKASSPVQTKAAAAQREEHESPTEEGNFIRNRDAWFWTQRTFPSGTVPANAHHLAVEHMKQMRAAQVAKRAVLAAASGTPSTDLGSISWSFDGPQGFGSAGGGEAYSARVPSFAVDPNNPGTLYIGTAGGGVWKTINNGTTWTPLTDDQASLSIGAVAVDPNNSNNIYAGTGEADYSWDSWYGEGLLESTDAGTTWTQVLTPFQGGYSNGPDFSQIAVQPNNSSVVLAAASNGLYRSADQGKTWTSVLSGNATAVIFDTKTSSLAYAAVGGSVYESSDSGSTWTTMTAGFPTISIWRIALAEDSGGTTLFAAIANGDTSVTTGLIYKTSVSTVSWTALTTPTSTCDWYRNAIAVDPANSNVIYVAGLDGDFSLDGGNTWTSLGYNSGAGNSWADKHWFAFSPTGSQLYIGSDGGIFVNSTPTSASYTVSSLNQTIGTMTFYPGMSLPAANTSSTLTFAGAQDHGLQVDNAGTWSYGDGDSYCGDGMTTYVDKDGHTAYANCQGGSANWINNATGGQDPTQWFPAQTGIIPGDNVSWVPPLTGDPEVDATVYAGTYRVYQSTNSATSWTPISPDLTSDGSYYYLNTIAVAPSSSDYVYAGSVDGMFSMTQNATAGASSVWTSTPFVASAAITKIVVLPDSPTDILVTVSGFGTGHVFHSTDGSTFIDISGNLPDTPANSIVADPTVANLYYVATDTGTFYTQDGGTTWAPLGSGLPNVVVQDIGITTGRILRVVTHGRGAWDLQLPGGVSLNTLSASPNSSSFNQPVTLTATVTSTTTPGTPTGTMTFFDGSTSLGMANLNASAAATLTTSSLSVGSHNITASYSGDATFLPSTSAVTTLVVSKAGTTTVTTASASSANLQQSITFTATVAASTSGTPTGSVQFFDGSNSLGSSSLNASGIATLAVSTLAAGSHSISATYGGDSNYSVSTSAAIGETIADFSITAATFSPASVSPGQSSSAQITVAPVSGFTGTVNLTCSVAPTTNAPTCSLNPTSVSAGGTGATATLQISTTAATTAALPLKHNQGGWWAIWLLVPAMLLGTTRVSAKKRLGYWMLSLMVMGCLFMAGCSGSGSSNNNGGNGGNSGTAAGAYTITVTATSGAIQHTTTATVTVQ